MILEWFYLKKFTQILQNIADMGTPFFSQFEIMKIKMKLPERKEKWKESANGCSLKRIQRWDSHDSGTHPVVNGDVGHSRPGTSEHVVGVIGGKLGGVVKASIPVRFPNDTAG